MQEPTAPVIHSIASALTEKFIRKRYPEEAQYLTLILDKFGRRPAYGHSDANVPAKHLDLISIGLPFEGEESVKLVTPAAFLIIEGTVHRLSRVRAVPSMEEIQHVLKESARKAGASESLANGLADVVGVELRTRLQDLRDSLAAEERNAQPTKSSKPTGDYQVWTIYPNDEFVGQPVSAMLADVEANFAPDAKRRKFQLFVRGGSVLVGRGKDRAPVQLENREYRLLLLFVLNKGYHLNPVRLHGIAWTKTVEYMVTDEKEVMAHLKVPVTAIRKKLKPFCDFHISRKERGYICTGRFSACVILPTSEAKMFKLRGL